MILVSACLVNISCRYDAKSSYTPEIMQLLAKYPSIILCPEVLGKLPIPREACEICSRGNAFSILTKKGKDFTKEFLQGAEIAFEIAIKNNVQAAILKSKSPSCGVDNIYDGSFTKTLINGDGIFAKKLKNAKISVYTEDNFHILL